MFKRGQVETPVNWVFVLVAGAIILLFFAIVIFRMQSTTTKQSQATLITNLNSIFTGTSLSSETSAIIENLPKQNIHFECQGYSLGDLTGGFEDRLTFAPSILSLQPLIVWSVSWNVPFFVSNFLFLTNPNLRYVFVYNPESSQARNLKNRIEQSLSKDITKIFVTSASQIVENGAETKFIFIDTNIEALHPSFHDIKINIQKINNNGIIEFYTKEQNTDAFELKLSPSSIFFEDTTLIAGIIVDDAEYLDCMMNKAFERYKEVSYILNQRVLSLKSGLLQCNNKYSNASEQLYNLLASTSYIDQKKQDRLQTFVIELNTLINQLKINNQELPLHSCPTIY